MSESDKPTASSVAQVAYDGAVFLQPLKGTQWQRFVVGWLFMAASLTFMIIPLAQIRYEPTGRPSIVLTFINLAPSHPPAMSSSYRADPCSLPHNSRCPSHHSALSSADNLYHEHEPFVWCISGADLRCHVSKMLYPSQTNSVKCIAGYCNLPRPCLWAIVAFFSICRHLMSALPWMGTTVTPWICGCKFRFSADMLPSAG